MKLSNTLSGLKFKEAITKGSSFLLQHPELVTSGLEFGKYQNVSSGISFAKNVVSALNVNHQPTNDYDFNSELQKYYPVK